MGLVVSRAISPCHLSLSGMSALAFGSAGSRKDVRALVLAGEEFASAAVSTISLIILCLAHGIFTLTSSAKHLGFFFGQLIGLPLRCPLNICPTLIGHESLFYQPISRARSDQRK